MKKGVKFCGVTQESDIQKAATAGARAVGVIVRPDATLDERSKNSRSISVERACELARATPHGMDFVVAPRTGKYEEIVDIGTSIGPDRLQIAEAQDPELMKALRTHFKGGPTAFLAQVIPVGEGTDPEIIDDYAPYVHFFHLDSAGPLPGGNGIAHDLEKSRELTARAHEHGKLVVLAGGLTVDTVAEAVRTVQPDSVDAESANRDAAGVYDLELMRQFVQNAMGAVES